jgi:hypothetical protein
MTAVPVASRQRSPVAETVDAEGRPLDDGQLAVFGQSGSCSATSLPLLVGRHDDWATYDRVMREERRTAVLVTPTRH